ncbi:MAG: hypothetical protein POELPBGB_01392 [Bacteroidia bacterium]|nr:hypothetical protein [Bacteroidia bacterium]
MVQRVIFLVLKSITIILLFYCPSSNAQQKVGSISSMYNTLGDSILIKQQNDVFMPELTPFGWSYPVNSAQTMTNDMKQRKGNGTTADDILKQQQNLAVYGNSKQATQQQINAQQQNQLNGRPPEQSSQQKQMKEFNDLLFEVSNNKLKFNDDYYKSSVYKNDFVNYQNAFTKLKDMLEERTALSIADAYYYEEAAYGNVLLSYEQYKSIITQNVDFIRQWLKENNMNMSDPEMLHMGIQRFNSDTLFLKKEDKAHAPFFYDYLNYDPAENRTNYFVTKILATGGGQCHTLPTAYLIHAEALKIDAFLGYSLSHSFIRYKNHLGATLNFETTTGSIMPDQFYLETLPRMAKAMNNKIYITNLNKKQIIASVMIDLAVTYVKEHWLYDKQFIRDCMNTAATYFPNKDYVNGSFRYLNKRLLADELNTQVQTKRYTDFSQIEKDPETFAAYNNLTNFMEQENTAGIQEFPESDYMQLMKYYDTKQKLQRASKINGRQPRDLFFSK